jgi:hypothetical protein
VDEEMNVIDAGACGYATPVKPVVRRDDMSKGMDSKKQGKKKPQKTMMEKRADKRAKKESRGFSIKTK